MMRASHRSRLVFAVLSPIFLLLCVAALYGEDHSEWSRYQDEFVQLYSTKARAKLEEAQAKNDEQEIAHWNRILDEIAHWQPEVKQIYLEDANVADRCTTCHLGIDNPLFEDAPEPFRTHPGTMLRAHEVGGIGCTLCHDGQGSATTVEAAHGHEANWPRAMLPDKLVQSRCSRCHPVTLGLTGAELVTEGSELFMTQGCYGCHDVALTYLPKFSPPLTNLKAKLQDPQAWIEAWLRQPTHLAPDTLMPNFLLSDEEVGKITAFLLTLGTPQPMPPVALDAAKAADGKTLFTERGCRGCHGVEPDEHSVSPRVPHLGNEGSKVTAEWLDQWIADPKKINPDTAMPKVALEDDERHAIVSYLMTLKRSEPLPKPMDLTGFDPAQGKELLKYYECFGCHAIEGFEQVRPSVPNLGEFARRAVAELDFGTVPNLPRTKWDWLRHKLHEPRAYESADIKLKMPVMALTDEEMDALIAFVMSLDPLPLPAHYVVPASAAAVAARNASWMVARLHCNGCHRWKDKEAHLAAFVERKSRVGPTLDGVGGRLQGQYLYDFLMEPKQIRPWLTLRMPNFGFEPDVAQKLVAGLAGLAGTQNPYTYVAKVNVDQEKFERGFRRFHHYKCIQCHPSSTDQGLPEGLNPDDLSINLMLAKERLRPEWFADFLARPKQLAGTDTRMPTVFYTVDGVPKVEHPQEDINDIVTYVMGMKEDAEVTIAAYEKEIQKEEKKDEIDWSNVEY